MTSVGVACKDHLTAGTLCKWCQKSKSWARDNHLVNRSGTTWEYYSSLRLICTACILQASRTRVCRISHSQIFSLKMSHQQFMDGVYLSHGPEQPLVWSQHLNSQQGCAGPPRLPEAPRQDTTLAVPVLAAIQRSGPQRCFRISDLPPGQLIAPLHTSGGRSTYLGEWHRKWFAKKLPNYIKNFCGLGTLI